jgi:hypothetical protein
MELELKVVPPGSRLLLGRYGPEATALSRGHATPRFGLAGTPRLVDIGEPSPTFSSFFVRSRGGFRYACAGGYPSWR